MRSCGPCGSAILGIMQLAACHVVVACFGIMQLAAFHVGHRCCCMQLPLNLFTGLRGVHCLLWVDVDSVQSLYLSGLQ
jgi:hypothetical protein